MSQRVFTCVQDLKAAVGEQFGPTDWVEISQQTVDRFADVTGDHQWIHVDPERAAASSLGGTIVHGHLTLSMLPGFASRLYAIRTGAARLNYGLNKVRFPAPVRVGTKVRATATIKSLHDVPAGVRIVFGWTVEAQDTDRPVCTAETITLVVS
ncbi:MAG: MaoC family dehydratase [Streptomyces sp.]|nr:MaoC family dehydratase [Streptomyces sp.]